MNMATYKALADGSIENFITASIPGGIEAQEARGQQTFVNSEVLPIEMAPQCTREKLEQMGVVFGEQEDDLFVKVSLPVGWTKKATDHSMWSDLLDYKGRKRASIFYKAAFYDRSARISLNKRYGFSLYKGCDYAGTEITEGYEYLKTVITDGGITIHTVGIRQRSDFELADKHEAEAREWLGKNYPEWESETAYWD